jgi:hypothetical protein
VLRRALEKTCEVGFHRRPMLQKGPRWRDGIVREVVERLQGTAGIEFCSAPIGDVSNSARCPLI